MMSLNCSICLMPIFGVGKVYRIWTPKGSPPQCYKGCGQKGHTLNAVTDRELTSRLQRCRHRALPLCLRWKCFGYRLANPDAREFLSKLSQAVGPQWCHMGLPCGTCSRAGKDPSAQSCAQLGHRIYAGLAFWS